MLFRRAIRSARDAVKELDDAMTETAVVTNYTISDLWKKLPEYTKRANELGVSTLAAYQSATLYYQQGLNDTQVSDMSVETLKMARIAGIEAADATNLMTGAIRAFNMEINKMSAQRVNDVYNKLAAMTAANTEGIATAMTKVASIAHSVGAEFENVAAFLAQMIETTQEAPETLGTALKTVFARFAEVKKLYSEGQITGSDEEGEEINVNKIQEALRTVGISMTDFLVGNEGLDQVIMRLAQKWDSLDTVTQRYIATMAAGSRQQSRFISLLQDFGRTQELINAANNSEGAAQNQFEKTLDSL
jgi:TP901 family phage tail tape measure protein